MIRREDGGIVAFDIGCLVVILVAFGIGDWSVCWRRSPPDSGRHTAFP